MKAARSGAPHRRLSGIWVGILAGLIGCSAQVRVNAPPAPTPLPDADADGVADVIDECPGSKEDGLDPAPKDGCPIDKDRDGIKGAADKCPNEPETYNGYKDEDGCPDTKPEGPKALVAQAPKTNGASVTSSEIKLNEEVLFVTGSAAIDHKSDELIAEIAGLLKQNADIDYIEVAGHADKRGAEKSNLSLTQKRAEAVMNELISNGVDANRLRSMGYGSYCPLDGGDTEAAYARDRRVEFKILRRAGKDLDPRWGGCDKATKKGLKIAAIPPTAPKTAAVVAPPTPPPVAPTPPPVDPLVNALAECQKSDPKSCNAIGLMFESGNGAIHDLDRASQAYKSACDGGNLSACANLGDLLTYEEHEPASYARAAVLFKQACDGGEMHGCEGLGTLHEQGKGLPQDFARAATFYTQSCAGGVAAACEEIGLLTLGGLGVAKDRGIGVTYLTESCQMNYEMACEKLRLLGPEQPPEAQPSKSEPEAPPPATTCQRSDPDDCRQQCERGSAESCDILGELYVYGNGVARDPAHAFVLFKQATSGGFAPAFSDLGLLYEGGVGTKLNLALALESYAKGCDRSDQLSCTNLGNLYVDGRGVTQDQAKGAGIYKLACEAGEMNACAALAGLYVSGAGVQASGKTAIQLYGRACRGAIAQACTAQGTMLLEGKLVPADRTRAIDRFDLACHLNYSLGCTKAKEARDSSPVKVEAAASGGGGCFFLFPWCWGGGGSSDTKVAAKASTHVCVRGNLAECTESCDGGESESCDTLGSMYVYGEGGAAVDYAKAFGLFTKSSAAGFAHANADLGLMFEGGFGASIDLPKAVASYQLACDKGDLLGCASLGRMNLDGRGVAKDEARAVALFKQACDGGEASGCFSLGLASEKGLGLAVNASGALDLYVRACELDFAPACAARGELLFRGGGSLQKDPTLGLVWMATACRKGYQRACLRTKEADALTGSLGAGLALQGSAKLACSDDDSEAKTTVALFKKSCDAGDTSACTGLGVLFANGKGTPQDYARAAGLFKQACDAGDGPACAQYGGLLLQGKGVAQDKAKGLELLKKQCEKGNKAACDAAK